MDMGEEKTIEQLCEKLVTSNRKIKRLYRRAKLALASAQESVAQESDNSALVAKAMSRIGDNPAIGNENAARLC